MPAPTSTKTVGDLQTYVKRQFGDESGVQITDADIVRWANQGAMAIVSKNPILEAVSDTATVIGQRNYAMPSDIISMIAVEFDSKYILTATSMENMKELTGSHQTMTGVPQYWYKFANEIFLWPEPSTVATLRLYYVQAPEGMTVAADAISIPDRYYEHLCNFVMSKAYELDEDATQSSSQRRLFEDSMTQLTNAENVQQGQFHVVNDDYDGGYYATNYWSDGYGY